jgi:hypothetical protein
MGERGFIFGGLSNKKNKRRLLTQTEKKKIRKKKKAEAINGKAYASTISEPRRMRGRERGGQGLHDAT